MQYVINTIPPGLPEAAANNSGGGVSGSGGAGEGSTDYFMKKYQQIGFYFGSIIHFEAGLGEF